MSMNFFNISEDDSSFLATLFCPFLNLCLKKISPSSLSSFKPTLNSSSNIYNSYLLLSRQYILSLTTLPHSFLSLPFVLNSHVYKVHRSVEFEQEHIFSEQKRCVCQWILRNIHFNELCFWGLNKVLEILQGKLLISLAIS